MTETTCHPEFGCDCGPRIRALEFRNRRLQAAVRRLTLEVNATPMRSVKRRRATRRLV